MIDLSAILFNYMTNELRKGLPEITSLNSPGGAVQMKLLAIFI